MGVTRGGAYGRGPGRKDRPGPLGNPDCRPGAGARDFGFYILPGYVTIWSCFISRSTMLAGRGA